MPATDAQIAASRRNGQLSRGPKTAEGKAISSKNAIRHGMAAESVVPDDDAAEVARRSDAMLAEMKPGSEMGRFLVRRLARLSVRVERCGERELAADAHLVAHAEEAFDEARLVEVEALLARLGDDPATSSRRLRAMPEGVARLVERLEGLGDRLASRRWDRASGEMLCHLTGVGWDDPAASGMRELAEEVEAGDPSRLARPALAKGIAMQADRLREQAETLDHEQIEADRAGAPARAGFVPSKEVALARRYEAAASRELFKALKELRQVEAEAAEVVATTEVPAPASPGSFRAEPPAGPTPTPRPASPASPAPAGPRFEGSRAAEMGDWGQN